LPAWVKAEREFLRPKTTVWSSGDAKADAKLPVIVWIYGGGFTLGSSGMAMYSGENVAKKGAIFVSFNYRVGALGNMAHPELTA
jgi:para-nitrobenzyl esterase